MASHTCQTHLRCGATERIVGISRASLLEYQGQRLFSSIYGTALQVDMEIVSDEVKKSLKESMSKSATNNLVYKIELHFDNNGDLA